MHAAPRDCSNWAGPAYDSMESHLIRFVRARSGRAGPHPPAAELRDDLAPTESASGAQPTRGPTGMACCMRIALVFVLLVGLGSARGEEPQAKKTGGPAASVNYARDVRPVLSDNCFACHGPDDQKRKAGLRFDTKGGAFAKLESGSTAVVPGKPEESELIDRIESHDADLQMPPKKSGKQLTAAQIAILRRWVEQGAQDLDALGIRGPGETRSSSGQECGLAQGRNRPFHPGEGRGRRAFAGSGGREDDADPPRDARPDRASADARRGRRVSG